MHKVLETSYGIDKVTGGENELRQQERVLERQRKEIEDMRRIEKEHLRGIEDIERTEVSGPRL